MASTSYGSIDSSKPRNRGRVVAAAVLCLGLGLVGVASVSEGPAGFRGMIFGNVDSMPIPPGPKPPMGSVCENVKAKNYDKSGARNENLIPDYMKCANQSAVTGKNPTPASDGCYEPCDSGMLQAGDICYQHIKCGKLRVAYCADGIEDMPAACVQCNDFKDTECPTTAPAMAPEEDNEATVTN
mmetsp:Transcript_14095/g.42361  ORF Transcript_14095/g.42361 Transcript_14095/m.42361 type:complete len:184 (-) Transcript_14095:32-583(-)